MAQVKNKVLLPNIQRNVEDEFPKQRISDFLVTEVEKLKERYGDEQLFVSCRVFLNNSSKGQL